MTARNCILAAIAEIETLPQGDPSREMMLNSLRRTLDDTTLSDGEKLVRAKSLGGEFARSAAQVAVRDKLSLEKLAEWEQLTNSHTDFVPFAAGVRKVINPNQAAERPSVEAMADSLFHTYMQKLSPVFETYMKGWFFVRTRDTIDFQRELLGVNTGNAEAAASARIVRETFDELINRLNSLGVYTGRIVHHHPQSLSPGLIAKRREYVINEMAALLDPSEHADPRAAAEAAVATLLTRHVNDLGAGSFNMQRQLHYRTDDPERLINFLNEFGTDDVLRQYQSSMRRMTRMIAAAESFGPDPHRVVNEISVRLQENIAKLPKAQRRFAEEFQAKQVARTFDVISGAADIPANMSVAMIGAGIRASMVPILLGKVAIDLITVDPLISLMQQARRVGLGQALNLKTQGIMSMFSPDVRARLSDYYASLEQVYWMGSPNSRFTQSEVAEGFANTAQKVSQAAYRLSGAWDAEQLNRRIVSFELGKSSAAMQRTAWNDLDPRVRRDLENGGLTQRNWEEINQFGRVDEFGLFDPTNLPQATREAYGAWFHKTLNTFILRPDAESRSLMFFGGAAGTLPGELARHATHFLSWPMEFSRKAALRQWRQGAPGTAIFAGSVFAAGMVSEQLRAISAGEPAFEWNSTELTQRALIRSGLLTPIGDAALAAVTGNVRGDLGLGPALELPFDVLRSGGRAIQRHVDGETDRAKAELVRAMGRVAPNTFWFDALAVQPIIDGFNQDLDPDYLLRQERMFMDQDRVGY